MRAIYDLHLAQTSQIEATTVLDTAMYRAKRDVAYKYNHMREQHKGICWEYIYGMVV